MRRPTKGDIREQLRQVRECLVSINAALVNNNVPVIEKELIKAVESMEEAAVLAEERYDITIFEDDDDEGDESDEEE